MKSFIKKAIFATTICAGAVALAACKDNSATDSASSGKGDPASVITKLSHGQLQVSRHFPLKDHGLTAYVAEPKQGGQPVLFYANDKTGDVIYGMLFDKNGNNLTEKYINKHIKPLLAKKLFDTVGSTSSFLIGKPDAPHQIYVLAEPNCSVCHKLYTDLKPFIKKGDLSVRWIMSAFLRKDSTGKAAAILQAKDPAKMLAKDESEDFNMKTEEGAIKALASDKITESTKSKLKANMEFMAKNGIRGTPAVFFMDDKGKAVRIDGYPQQDLKALISTIGKLPVTLATKSVAAATVTPAKKVDTKTEN